VSETFTIVVNNLPPVAKAEQHGPRGQMAKKSTSKRERLKTSISTQCAKRATRLAEYAES
jgi:hypothetical protein